MRALWLLLVGCSELTSNTTLDRSAVCKPGDPSIDAAVFAQLTAHRWGYCGSNNGLCLTLSATGDYHTIAGFDDYFIEDAGRWNFLARDATSGLVCFDDGTMTDFELTSSGLVWKVSGLLPARDAITGGGTRDALDEMQAPELFATLTANAWQRQNELDLFYEPTSFAIARDGTWDAEWRFGECRASGTLSIERAPQALGAPKEALRSHPTENACDTRGGGMTAGLPTIDEYAAPGSSGDTQFLTFHSYGGGYGLRVRASWRSTLHGDTTKEWTVTLTNVMVTVQTVSTLLVTLTPIAETDNGYTATGAKATLVDQTLGEMIDSFGTLETTASLALPAPGLYSLGVEVVSADNRQPYQNRASYVLELKP